MSKFVQSPLMLALALTPLLATASLAAPAMAKPGEQQSKLDVEVKTRSGTTVYCVSEPVTGSFIPQKICRTREQWVEAGATFRTTAKLALNNSAQDARN